MLRTAFVREIDRRYYEWLELARPSADADIIFDVPTDAPFVHLDLTFGVEIPAIEAKEKPGTVASKRDALLHSACRALETIAAGHRTQIRTAPYVRVGGYFDRDVQWVVAGVRFYVFDEEGGWTWPEPEPALSIGYE